MPHHRHELKLPKNTPVVVGYPTERVTDIKMQGGYGQLFSRIVHSGIWARLSYTTRAAYAVMVVYANRPGYSVRIGFGTLAKDAGIPRSCAQKAIDELVAKRLIRVLDQGRKRRGKINEPNVYELLVPQRGYVDTSDRITRGGGGPRTAPEVHSDTAPEVHPHAARAVRNRTAPTREPVPPGRSESISPQSIDSLSDEELEEAKEMVIASADPALQPFLRKSDPKTHKLLRARINDLFNGR